MDSLVIHKLLLACLCVGCGLIREPFFDCPSKMEKPADNTDTYLERRESYQCVADTYKFTYPSGVLIYHCTCNLKQDICFNHSEAYFEDKWDEILSCTTDRDSKYYVSQDDCEGVFKRKHLARVCKKIDYKPE